jgi:hypothetical protein
MWRWWHLVQVFIITLFYFVNWKVAHYCLLRLIRIGMESKWLHFFLIRWSGLVWQPNMTVFFTFMWPFIVTKFLKIKPTRCTNFSNLFLEMKLYMFRTVPPSIIRSYSLQSQQ